MEEHTNMNSYGETVIIPFFQKKISELQSMVTVLEANYLVEQQKTKDLTEKLSEVSANQSSASKDAEAQLAQFRSDLSRKTNEANQLSETNSLIAKRVEDLKRVIAQQEQTIFGLEAKIKLLEETINTLPKKRKQKEAVLDGSTF